MRTRVGRGRQRILWAVLVVALGALPALLAVAAEGIATFVSGKRLERRGGVVTEVTSPAPRANRAKDAERAPRPSKPSDKAAAEESRDGRRTRARAGRRSRSRRGCKGVVVRSGSSLQSAIDAAPAGAKLCIRRGTYRVAAPIVPKDGQTLAGAGRRRTSITTASAPTVIDAKATSGVTIKRLVVSGAAGSEACAPACGRGIAAGANTVIDRVRAHDNAITGIGGSEGGLLVTNSELDHNGSAQFIGCCASGIKTGTAFTIVNSYVHNNAGVGIWCDMGCQGSAFRVFGNVVVDNSMGGVRYEISSVPAVIQGNRVQGNNVSGAGGHGGIEINSSRNVVVESNTLGGNVGPGVVANGNRSPGVANVDVVNNVLRGDEVTGCGDGVSCVGNR